MNQTKSAVTRDSTAMLGALPTPPAGLFLSIQAVLDQFQLVGSPMGRSTFLNGVRADKFPQPVRLTPKRPVWRKADIDSLIASL